MFRAQALACVWDGEISRLSSEQLIDFNVTEYQELARLSLKRGPELRIDEAVYRKFGAAVFHQLCGRIQVAPLVLVSPN
jgi:hypothetical protein